jgi:hypothetical protein
MMMGGFNGHPNSLPYLSGKVKSIIILFFVCINISLLKMKVMKKILKAFNSSSLSFRTVPLIILRKE